MPTIIVPAPIARRTPQLNATLSVWVCSRWAQIHGHGSAPQPQRLVFRALLGARRITSGYAVNLAYRYYSPSGAVYQVEGFVTGFSDGPLTGEAFARSCSCPDFTKRRGPAAASSRERCCKHMQLFEALAATWRGRLPWLNIISLTEEGTIAVREC